MNENKNEKKIPNFFFLEKNIHTINTIHKIFTHTHIQNNCSNNTHTQTESEREREKMMIFFSLDPHH